MKTRMILLSAVLACGSTAFAGDRDSYGTSGTTTQSDSSRDSTRTSDQRETAYESAIKPDRTMRHNTRESRASTDYNQYETDRVNQDRSNSLPATRE